MEIQFKINRADLCRRGIDSSSSIVSLEVNPQTLPRDQCELLARHLLPDETGGVCYVVYDPERAKQSNEVVPVGGHAGADLVEAKDPTFDSLLVALAQLQWQVSMSGQAAGFCAGFTAAQKVA